MEMDGIGQVAARVDGSLCIGGALSFLVSLS